MIKELPPRAPPSAPPPSLACAAAYAWAFFRLHLHLPAAAEARLRLRASHRVGWFCLQQIITARKSASRRNPGQYRRINQVGATSPRAPAQVSCHTLGGGVQPIRAEFTAAET